MDFNVQQRILGSFPAPGTAPTAAPTAKAATTPEPVGGSQPPIRGNSSEVLTASPIQATPKESARGRGRGRAPGRGRGRARGRGNGSQVEHVGCFYLGLGDRRL